MIYRLPPRGDPLDQGDIIDGCPTLVVTSYNPEEINPIQIDYILNRVIILTQTCDLANNKASLAVVAPLLEAQELVDRQLLKAADIKGTIRAGRVYGLYFLPKNLELGLPECVVDLRHLQTIRVDLLAALCRRGQRRARLLPLYREHLAKHLADTYSRIGLPEPYETD